MANLTYWVCHSLSDSSVYSFRARTRRECIAWLADAADGDWRRANYSAPCKVVAQYADRFDLLQQCMGEGGLGEEALSRYDARDRAEAVNRG